MREDDDALEETTAELWNKGVRVHAVDVSTQDDVEELAEAALDAFFAVPRF